MMDKSIIFILIAIFLFGFQAVLTKFFQIWRFRLTSGPLLTGFFSSVASIVIFQEGLVEASSFEIYFGLLHGIFSALYIIVIYKAVSKVPIGILYGTASPSGTLMFVLLCPVLFNESVSSLEILIICCILFFIGLMLYEKSGNGVRFRISGGVFLLGGVIFSTFGKIIMAYADFLELNSKSLIPFQSFGLFFTVLLISVYKPFRFKLKDLFKFKALIVGSVIGLILVGTMWFLYEALFFMKSSLVFALYTTYPIVAAVVARMIFPQEILSKRKKVCILFIVVFAAILNLIQ